MNPDECPTEDCEDPHTEEQALLREGQNAYSVRVCYACGAEFRVRFLAVERFVKTEGQA